MKKLARQALFWPLINSGIEDMMKNFPTWLTLCNQKPNEPVVRHPAPQESWSKLAADLFWLYGHYYLLVVDYNSKFNAAENLKNLQSFIVINKCKKIFYLNGIPKQGGHWFWNSLNFSGIFFVLELFLKKATFLVLFWNCSGIWKI